MCFGGGGKSEPYKSPDQKKKEEYDAKYGEKNRREKIAADKRGAAYNASLTADPGRDFLKEV